MKSLLLILGLCFSSLLLQAQSTKTAAPDKNKKVLTVETACGQCKLGMEGKSCDLAIRLNGQSYFVDGTAIDDHGDAHAKDGFCNSVRKAEVQGEIVDNRFVATYFHLLPQTSKSKKQSKQL